MNLGYRLEPIVDLLTNKSIGQELLAGTDRCPIWDDAQWQEWYEFLAQEIPLLLPNLRGLLFINLSGHQLLDGAINHSIRSLRNHARRIVIEWTEHQFHDEDLVDILAKLNFLKGMGFVVAIDDIGAGVGVDGLGRAGAMKADFCKIDGTYFQTIRERGAEYLRGLCQHLSYKGSRVIVEWVETEEDYKLALASGAHLGQGYFWNKAVTDSIREQN
ncbi:MAG: EAL domain-containing protein [Acidithiobacillus sp.]